MLNLDSVQQTSRLFEIMAKLFTLPKQVTRLTLELNMYDPPMLMVEYIPENNIESIETEYKITLEENNGN